MQKNQNFLFIAASALLFDEKIRPSAVQTVFHPRLVDPKPSSELKMYGSRIFWRKRGQLEPMQAVFRGLEEFLY